MSHADDLLLQEKCDLMAMMEPIHITLHKAAHRGPWYKLYDWNNIKFIYDGRGFYVTKC